MKINGSEIGGSYYHDVLTLTCEGKQFKVTTLEIWEWLAQKAAQQSVQPTIATAALEDSPFETGIRRNAVVASNRNSD